MTREKAIITGSKNLAEYVLDHIDDIRDGASIVFAVECPEHRDEKDADYWLSNSTGWYGIEACENFKHFGHDDPERIALYIDYFGDLSWPVIVIIDNAFGPDENLESLARDLEAVTRNNCDAIGTVYTEIRH